MNMVFNSFRKRYVVLMFYLLFHDKNGQLAHNHGFLLQTECTKAKNLKELRTTCKKSGKSEPNNNSDLSL